MPSAASITIDGIPGTSRLSSTSVVRTASARSWSSVMLGLHSTTPSTWVAIRRTRFCSVAGSSALLANSTAMSSCRARAWTPSSTPVKNGLPRSGTTMPMCPVRTAGTAGAAAAW